MLKDTDVLKVADLARLKLSKDELKKFTAQLEGILDLFKKVQKVDVEDVGETSQVTGLKNVVGEDEPKTDPNLCPSQRELLLENAPKSEGGSIIVPKVVGD